MYPINKINKPAFPITITKLGEVWFPTQFCICFIVDLLLQHMFCCVNLTGIKLENMKCDPNNTHIPYNSPLTWSPLSNIPN
jgi:hypothetical protein